MMGMRSNDTEKYTSLDSLVSTLVVVAIGGSWCAWVIVAQLVGTTPGDTFSAPQGKPFIYYISHGIGILAAISAGLISGLRGGYSRLSGTMRAAFWVLIASSIAWALIAYSIQDIISWKAFGATSPLVWLSCLLIFAGMNKSTWKLLEPFLLVLACITAVMALHMILTSPATITERSFTGPVRFMVVLMWFGGWVLLSSFNCSGSRLFFRFFPYLVFVFSTIYTQTRSWFVMSILLLIAYKLVVRCTVKRKFNPVALIVFSNILIVITFLFANDFLGSHFAESFASIKQRTFVDSRTEQYVEFFSQVPVSDLLLGRGPNGAWYYFGGEYQFFDNAYLWMAFIGGLPILASYFILVIYPGFKACLLGATGHSAAAAALVILWGLALTGFSTYLNPSLTPHSYLLCLMSGRCLRYVSEVRL